ncbi:MAG: AAA family ATPase [Desulfomonile sp.]|nr:AAA family ATPase [Deltaproteobacteria bacterium]
MDCHCKDHLPGEWHSPENCDCAGHEHPTFTFVITKVMETDPGVRTVFISKPFMENLKLVEGDPVEILCDQKCFVQARSHPNSWIDTRMISLDKDTMEAVGLPLFGQVKLRKAICCETESIVLEVPPHTTLSRIKVRGMIEKIRGAVINGQEYLRLCTDRGEEIRFRLVRTEPDEVSRLSVSTRLKLVDQEGQDYISVSDTTFKDVGGLAEAVRKVREVVQLPLRHPEIFQHLGIDPPRGVLLHGPSGTGKTLIARAVANDTGCYFKSIIGTEIMDKYYGESEAKLRAAFEEADKSAPAIIFIDEIDALAPHRNTTEGDVERRVTAQLLALMDGLEDRGSIIVLAATNLPNVLDSALRRPGRFDREIFIGVPDKAGRKEILEIHTRDMPLEKTNLDELAEKTHGFVGADLKALCREASYKALQRILPGLEDTEQKLSQDFLDAVRVESQDFEEALKEMRPSSGRSFEVDLTGCGWERLAGYSSEIDFLKEMILWPLQNDSFLSGLGVNRPAGLLLTGPSGVGKTLMAKSLAKESGFNVIEIRGPELLSKYMGESERNVRDVFRQARQMAPTILILDGIDSMASSGWSDSTVMERVVNQLAMEMNAGSGEKPIVVVATANRSADVPTTLKATARFGYELNLRPPVLSDRILLFDMYLRKDGVVFTGDFTSVAQESEGLAGGDIEEVCRRVILQAARRALDTGPDVIGKILVSGDDLLKMLDRFRLTGGTRNPGT